MKSVIRWTLVGGLALALASLWIDGNPISVPFGRLFVSVWVGYNADPSGFTGWAVGITLTLFWWMIPGLILRAVYLMLTPQEKY